MNTRARQNHRREHIAKRFDEAQRHITFTTSPLEPFLSMRCGLCQLAQTSGDADADLDNPYMPGRPAGYVCSWPLGTTPTLGDLIDRAGIHFAQAHRRG